MPAKIFIFFMYLCLNCSLYAQTSLEEWKYCKYGYKDQIEKGLDPIKKGYIIDFMTGQPIFFYNAGRYEQKRDYKFFSFKTEKDKILKAIICVYDCYSKNPKYYVYPSPLSDSDILKEFSLQFYSDDNKDFHIAALNWLVYSHHFK